MKKQDMRTVKTRAALSAALMDLMDKEPFDEIKVVDICERAQVHRTTFYKHFEDKYQLLSFVIDEVIAELSGNFAVPDNCENPSEFYHALLNSVIEYIHNNERKFKLIAKNNTSGVFIHTLQKILSQHIAEYLYFFEKKGFRFNAPVPLLAQYRSGGLIASAYYLLGMGKNQYTVEELCTYLCKISGITTDSKDT